MAVEQLEVKITNEHLNKFSKTKSVKALAELIWNSLDADATEVNVVLERNQLGGIEHIIIEDNGVGINYDSVQDQFGRLGGSHKISNRNSPSGRRYHGKLGQGRYNGFALGKTIKWESVYRDSDVFSGFHIIGNFTNMNFFEISTPQKAIGGTSGVTVSITELYDEKVNEIGDSEILAQNLTLLFAPYLLAYKGISIIIDDIQINPHKVILSTKDFKIAAKNEEKDVIGSLKVIEWNNGNSKNLYLCNSDGITYDEEPSGVKSSSSFSHTAYLQSEVIENLMQDNQIEVRELNSDYKAIRNEASEILKGIYRERLANEASKEVDKLKEEKIYPYTGEANNAIEVAERQVFDICAVKINQYLPEISKMKKDSKQFTYRLVKEALQANPNSLSKILHEVLNLPTNQQEEFASILQKTSLNSIINTTKLISDRISFINGLEQILFTSDYHKKLKERSQLHKILLGELWLFGEQYNYGYDDITLKNVLKKHISLLGRDNISEEIDYSIINDLNDIPDIGLYRQCVSGGDDYFENLIIELKRPSCVIGQDELNQIEKYAIAIEENEYFDKEKTKWKIVLLGIKIDKFAARKVTQTDREPGLLYSGGNMEVWVKEWNQIIQESKGKHKYLKDQLEINVKDNEEGMKYLKEKYKEYLPN